LVGRAGNEFQLSRATSSAPPQTKARAELAALRARWTTSLLRRDHRLHAAEADVLGRLVLAEALADRRPAVRDAVLLERAAADDAVQPVVLVVERLLLRVRDERRVAPLRDVAGHVVEAERRRAAGLAVLDRLGRDGLARADAVAAIERPRALVLRQAS